MIDPIFNQRTIVNISFCRLLTPTILIWAPRLKLWVRRCSHKACVCVIFNKQFSLTRVRCVARASLCLFLYRVAVVTWSRSLCTIIFVFGRVKMTKNKSVYNLLVLVFRDRQRAWDVRNFHIFHLHSNSFLSLSQWLWSTGVASTSISSKRQ